MISHKSPPCLQQNINRTKDTPLLMLKARYGMSFVSISEKISRFIAGSRWILSATIYISNVINGCPKTKCWHLAHAVLNALPWIKIGLFWLLSSWYQWVQIQHRLGKWFDADQTTSGSLCQWWPGPLTHIYSIYTLAWAAMCSARSSRPGDPDELWMRVTDAYR